MGGISDLWTRGFSNFSFCTFILFSIFVLTDYLNYFQNFDDSLPYFKRCEKLNPNDAITLIALREIYARKDDLDTSNIFKERLEKVQSGGKNDTSYFQE